MKMKRGLQVRFEVVKRHVAFCFELYATRMLFVARVSLGGLYRIPINALEDDFLLSPPSQQT